MLLPNQEMISQVQDNPTGSISLLTLIREHHPVERGDA